MKIKKLVACCTVAALLVLPGCSFLCKFRTPYYDITNKIGQSLNTMTTAYGVLEVMLEVAIQKELPNAADIKEMLDWTKSARDTVGDSLFAGCPVEEDVDKAVAAAAVAESMVEQAKELVE